jgi:tRNA pseudouridine55 synthase
MSMAERELGVPARGAVPEWSGLVLVDKPVGVTSHDVVARVRRRLRDRGAGHLGTLDPGASGLLVVALGAATRCIPIWQGGEKTYEARIRFGVVTDTQDTHGKVLQQAEVTFDEGAVRAATQEFVGDIDQVPPMVSALKIGGERLYRMARRGETVERRPRPVRVMAWDWTSFELPEAGFVVRVSGGTYVRTLAHDLGARLGSGAALAGLRRLRSEPFSVERAITMRALDTEPREDILNEYGVTLDEALLPMPAVGLDETQSRFIGYGGQPELPIGPLGVEPDWVGRGPRSVVVRDAGGAAIALGELFPGRTPELARLRPNVVFPWAVRQGGAGGGEDD